MSKKDPPCGHPRAAAMYFGDAMGCTQCGRKWKWVPAQWHEIVPRKEGEPQQLDSVDAPSQPEEKSILQRVLNR